MNWLSTLVTLPVGMMLAYTVLFLVWPRASLWVTGLLNGATPVAARIEDNFLWIGSTIPVPELPVTGLRASLQVAGVCAALLVVGGVIRKRSPLVLWIFGNVIVLMLTALWYFFEGSAAYDGPTFMLLLERTSVLMILAAPIFSVIVAALLPFNVVERSAMFVMLVALNFVMSLLRIAAFAILLAHFGVLAEATLYLFFGPLIDVVYFILAYSLCVVSLSHRLAKSEEAWEWL